MTTYYTGLQAACTCALIELEATFAVYLLHGHASRLTQGAYFLATDVASSPFPICCAKAVAPV